jgi:hypothetical protein
MATGSPKEAGERPYRLVNIRVVPQSRSVEAKEESCDSGFGNRRVSDEADAQIALTRIPCPQAYGRLEYPALLPNWLREATRSCQLVRGLR